jgi:hypothetical protein
MISFKKALCALSFGIGVSASLNAWAIEPDCGLCMWWAERCDAGIEHSCFLWDYHNCGAVVTQTC